MKEFQSPLPLFTQPASSAFAGKAVAGLVEERDAGGRLVGYTTFAEDGVPHGDMTRYGNTGAPQVQAQFARGVLSGPLYAFDDHGRMIQESHYAEGKLHGVTSTYQDGRLASRQHYVRGVLHGESLAYAASGLVVARMTYEAGKLHREAIFLHDGVVVRRVRYSMGLMEGETVEYTRDGVPAQSSPYRANLLHGTVRRFAPDGTVAEERRYQHGKPQGEWRRVDAAPTPADASAGTPKLVRQFEKWVRG
jgi:antitoxin component YwqK of YwqJK toxin-antitoxin module